MPMHAFLCALLGVGVISAVSGDVQAVRSQRHPTSTSRALLKVGSLQQQSPQQQPSARPASAASPQRAVLDRYCVTCHNQTLKTGGLALDRLDVAKVAEGAEIWEKVIRKLRTGMMPPIGRPRPDEITQASVVSYLETELDRAAAARPDPGRTETFHRLNRTEYQNVIRDLLGVDADVVALLPTDDASYGFDNIAGVLKVSQSLLERYLAAARKIARIAVSRTPPAPVTDTFSISAYEAQYQRVEGLPFGTRGGALIRYNFPWDGEYTIGLSFSCNQTEGCNSALAGSAGFEIEHRLDVTVDDDPVHMFILPPGGPKNVGTTSYEADKADFLRFKVTVPIKGGQRDLGVAFHKPPSFEPSDWPRVRFQRPSYEGNMVASGQGVYMPHLARVTVSGPFNTAGGPPDTASRRRIFVCRPANLADEMPCAKMILASLARRAYRRPVTEADLRGLLTFYEDGRIKDGGFEAGIEMALRALLTSPEFLFRTEADVAGRKDIRLASSRSDAGPTISVYRISDLELASRLSFFLWSSIPDDELLDVAAAGKLKDPTVLDRQVRRMLADARAEALTKSFLPQWLQLRKLEAITPSDAMFPNFDDSLRHAFQRETELFFDSIVRADHSVLDLLTANYTFLNERLATHYGVPYVKGGHFRRVTLSDDSPRRGLLGQGSVLAVTSHPNRTSPVLRGKWILDNILGSPPPPPPANVPPLAEKKPSEASQTMRERMAAHRANPVCAGCHSMLDPAGFALENFDSVGQWRTVDESEAPIDASGSLPDGTKFGDLTQFRAALIRRPERFVSALTEKLLTYALGRGLEYYDMPAVRTITRQAARGDYRFSSLVAGIVQSVPFQRRRLPTPAASTIAAVRPLTR